MPFARRRLDPGAQYRWSSFAVGCGVFLVLLYGLLLVLTRSTPMLVATILSALLTVMNLVFALRARQAFQRPGASRGRTGPGQVHASEVAPVPSRLEPGDARRRQYEADGDRGDRDRDRLGGGGGEADRRDVTGTGPEDVAEGSAHA